MAIDLSSSIKNAQNPVRKQEEEVPMVMMVKGENERVVGDYNSIDVMESETSALAKAEMWTAKAVGTKLVKKYPGRQWGVQVNMKGGVMIVSCPSLSTEKGYHIYMDGKNIDELCKTALTAGGEILERYNVSRRKDFDPQDLETLDFDWQDKVVSADAETKETL